LSHPGKFWQSWRVRTGYPVGIVYWLLAAPTPRAILIGGLVAAFGLLVRGLAAGHLQKDKELATTGPYASTRNPLYLGSAFLAAGFAIAGRSWMGGLIVAVYFAVFYYAVIRSEEKYLRERFGTTFDEYAARVPMFLPGVGATSDEKPSQAIRGAKTFSWAQYRSNREYQALLGIIAGLGITWLRMWIRARFGH
jgi:protein-S-isoprenylcysteine O-methyltransferase Ste14